MQPLEKSLGILGISKTASLTELKAAYRFPSDVSFCAEKEPTKYERVQKCKEKEKS